MITTTKNWFDEEHLSGEEIDPNVYKWLTKASNLTETIKKTRVEFSLNLLNQSFNKPFEDELQIFLEYDTDASFSLIRKVFLEGNKKPVIYARVIVPETTYLHYHNEFSRLGSAAIGNTLLYADSTIV